MAGSEDGSIVVWQADTGKVLTCISSEEFPPVTAIAFHPAAHILAVGYFGQQPVTIWIPGKKYTYFSCLAALRCVKHIFCSNCYRNKQPGP